MKLEYIEQVAEPLPALGEVDMSIVAGAILVIIAVIVVVLRKKGKI